MRFMKHARILLVDDDLGHAERVACSLKIHRHTVTICRIPAEMMDILREPRQDWNLIILNVTKSHWNCLTTVRNIKRLYRKWFRPCPEIVCMSAVYRGAHFRLD